MNENINKVKEATDIVAIIGERIKLNRSGGSYRALCPFHSEKTSSFFVNPIMQRYMCFGCHESGDCFTFLEKYENMSFSEALKYLALKAGIELEDWQATPQDHKRERLLASLSLAKEFYHYLLVKHALGQKAREYLTSRSISDETIFAFGLGASLPSWDGLTSYLTRKKGFSIEELVDAGLTIRSENGKAYDRFRDRVMFPLTNSRGQVVGFSGRVLNAEEKTAKYINSPETVLYHKSELLFGFSQLHRFIKEKEEVLITEGELDVLSSYQAHVKNVVAIKGSAISENQVKQLSRIVKRIVFALDSDHAGIAATKRAIQIASDSDVTLRVLLLQGGKDPDDIAKHTPETWREMVKKSVNVYDYIIDVTLGAHNLKTAEGKKESANELVSLLASISNPVEQAHYVQKVAKALAVSEEVLAKLIQRNSRMGNLPVIENKKEKLVKKDRHTLLEERALVILLQLPADLLPKNISKLEKIITNPTHIKLLILMKEMTNFDLREFAAKVPEELKEICTFLLSQDELDQDEAVRELGQVTQELDALIFEKSLKQASKRIGELEAKELLEPKEESELARLQSEVSKILQKTNVYKSKR